MDTTLVMGKHAVQQDWIGSVAGRELHHRTRRPKHPGDDLELRLI
jgi:hypothetical protein